MWHLQGWMMGFLALCSGAALPSSVYGQKFFERLEQKVREGLKVPGEVLSPGEPGTVNGGQATSPIAPNPAGTPASGNSSGITNGATGGTPSGSGTARPDMPAGSGSSSSPANPNPSLVTQPVLRPVEATPEPAVLGLELEELLVPGGGLTVTSVTPRSPADTAGFRSGDILVMLDNRPVLRLKDVVDVMSVRRPGERVTLRLRRDGQMLETTALLASSPKMAPAANTVPLTNPPENSVQTSTARLGIEVDDLSTAENPTTVQSGAIVMTVQPNSPAEAVGIRKGDVIVAVDGKLVTGVRTMVSVMNTLKPGQQIEVTYYSGNQMQRKTMPVAGSDGTLPAGTLAELKKKNEASTSSTATQESNGITGWLGGLGKMLGGSKSEPSGDSGNASTGENTLPTPVAPAAMIGGNADGAAKTATENAQLRSTVKQLEDRIAELERRLNSLQPK